MEKGKLVVVSGFSGAGKGTVMKALTSKYKDYALSVSATSRNPRPGEENGREYFFKTREEFEAMIKEGELVEYAQYVGNYYGTPKAYVEKQRSLGRNVLLEIEIQGALKIKEKFPEAVLIFLTTKDAPTLIQRLTDRGTEDTAAIHKRMARAAQEAEGVEAYDYIVVNDVLEDCVETIDKIIKTGHNDNCGNILIIENIKEGLKSFTEGES